MCLYMYIYLYIIRIYVYMYTYIIAHSLSVIRTHFGSPPLKELESGITPLVPRGFDPACWGLIQLPPLLAVSHTQVV